MRTSKAFQPTRPLRGATVSMIVTGDHNTEFQPTRPLRGATTQEQSDKLGYD